MWELFSECQEQWRASYILIIADDLCKASRRALPVHWAAQPGGHPARLLSTNGCGRCIPLRSVFPGQVPPEPTQGRGHLSLALTLGKQALEIPLKMPVFLEGDQALIWGGPNR